MEGRIVPEEFTDGDIAPGWQGLDGMDGIMAVQQGARGKPGRPQTSGIIVDSSAAGVVAPRTFAPGSDARQAPEEGPSI